MQPSDEMTLADLVVGKSAPTAKTAAKKRSRPQKKKGPTTDWNIATQEMEIQQSVLERDARKKAELALQQERKERDMAETQCTCRRLATGTS